LIEDKLMNDISVLNLFLEAGMVVKTVMVILLIASLLTWIIIVERYNFYKKIRVINDSFLERFWSGENLNLLYSEIKTETVPVYGALSVFKNSFKEFLQIDQTNEITELDLEGINRSMRVAIASDEEEMNKHLAFLANVGSVGNHDIFSRSIRRNPSNHKCSCSWNLRSTSRNCNGTICSNSCSHSF
jgi:biopolymer transport protein TolQ